MIAIVGSYLILIVVIAGSSSICICQIIFSALLGGDMRVLRRDFLHNHLVSFGTSLMLPIESHVRIVIEIDWKIAPHIGGDTFVVSTWL
jgi:hypothetical protein